MLSHTRGVSQEAAGTTGSEMEREQIKALLMHQVLSSNTRGRVKPFLFYRTQVATESKP